MANPYTDVRAITARLGQVQPRGMSTSGGLNPNTPTPSKESIQLGRAANKFAIQNPQLREEIERIASGSRSEKPSGFMGTVLGNPVAKTALRGLEAFAIPGRAVVSGARELTDALDGDAKTKARFGDFGNQVKDSQFGFGKAFKVDTGNIWLDRAIGFVGDVGLDPLTYATFGASAGLKGVQGSAKLGNYANKMTLAAKVLENTGDNVLAASVARRGRVALRNNPEVLERVGANKFGVYFFGKRVKVGKDGMGWRVPLSGTIGEIGESALSRARLGITNTRMGKYLQKMTMPKDFLDMRLGVARGTLNPEDAADALKLFQIVPKQRLARASAQQTLEQQLMSILKSEEPNLEAYRKSVYKFIEDPARLAAASEPEKRAYAVWKGFLDEQFDRVSTSWKSVDEAADIGKTENYFPRVRSDQAQKYMDSDGAFAADIRGVYMDDPFALPGAFTPRSLRPGKKWFGYVLQEGDMTTEKLNQLARIHGKIDFDFFETDVVDVMRKYISDTADELGIIQRNADLKETGFFRRIEEQRIRELEIDEDDVASARAFLDEQNNMMLGVEQDFRKAVTDLVDNVRSEQVRVSQGLATGERLAQDMSKYLYDMMDDVARKSDFIAGLRQRLVQMWGKETDIPLYALSDDFPVMLRPVLGQFDQMVDDLDNFNTIISDLHAQSMKAGYDAYGAEEALRQIEEGANAAHAAMKDAQESIRSAMELSNVIEGSWDSIVAGRSPRVGGTAAQSIIKDIVNILALRKSSTGQKAQVARAKAVGVTGAVKDFLDNALRPDKPNDAVADFFKSFWDEIAGAGQSGIAPTNVSRMSEDKFFNIILSAASPDTTIADLRAAAAYAIGRDIRLHQATKVEDLPKFVRRFHEDLKNMLKEAEFDEAARIARGKASKGLQEQLQNLKNRWGADYEAAVTMKNDLDELDAVARFVDDGFSVQFGDNWASVEFTDALIPALEQGISDGSSKAARLPWLYEYIDNADTVLGKQTSDVVTLGEVMEHVKKRADFLRKSYYEDTVEIEDVISANLLTGQNSRGATRTTRDAFVANYDSKVRQARKIANTEARVPQYSRGVTEKLRTADTARANLSESLVHYQAVSDAVQKFEAISGVLAPHGLVPTQDMWRGILRTVSDQYGSQYSDKVRRIIAGEEKFTEMYANFAKKLQEMKRLPAEEQIPVSRLFREVLDGVLSGEDAELMREILGPTMGRMVDKADMRLDLKTLESAVRTAGTEAEKQAAKVRLDDYVRNYIIPWAKDLDPTIRADKKPATDLLKELTRNQEISTRAVSKATLRKFRTPLSRDASEEDIYRWLNSMMKTVDPATGETVSPGAIAKMRNSYQGTEIFFRRMKDGYIDVESFFATLDGSADTPSGYAVQMIELANRLDGATVLSEDNPFVRGSMLQAVGPNYRKAYKGGAKVLDRAEAEAAEAAELAGVAREIVDAYKNPDLNLDELKELGFTKAMMAEREEVLAVERFDASIEYANAVKDQEMVSFLDSVAGINFAQFDEGIVVGTNRIEKFADDFIPETTASVNEDIGIIQGKLDDLDAQEMRSRAKVIEPYMVQRDGRMVYKSAEHKRAAQTKLDQWAGTEQGKFRSERLKLNGELDSANTRLMRASDVSAETVEATRTPIGFELSPVFATMPDGSVIKFTQAEWDSLYIPRYNQEGLKNAGDAARTAVRRRKEIIGILNELKDETYERIPLSELRYQLKILKKEPSASWSPGKKAQITRIERQIARGGVASSPRRKAYRTRLENELIQLEKQIPILETVIERNMKVVQNSALEKVRVLVKSLQESTPQDGGVHWMNQWQDVADQLGARTRSTGNLIMDEDWTKALPYSVVPAAGGQVKRSYANTTLSYYFNVLKRSDDSMTAVPQTWGVVENGMQKRRNSLQAMWRSNKSHAVLEQREELVRAAALTAYDDFDKYARMSAKASAEARKAADRTRVAVDDVQDSFRKAVIEMRNTELRAAKAAGAEFDTKTPFWSTNTEINYTLNGKVYSVPSVADMLADPAKYAKKARQRGDLFFDLKKPGNVVIFNEANEATRASIALFGMQNVLMRESADIFEAGVVNPSFARSNEAYNIMSQWSEEAKTLADNINTVRQAVAAERQSLSDDIAKALNEQTKDRLDMFEFAAELRAVLDDFDPSIELSQGGMMQMETLISNLRKRSQLMERVVQGMPSKADTTALNASKKPATRAKWMQVHLDWINGNRSALRALAQADLADPGEARIWSAFLNAFAAEGRFTLQEGRIAGARSALDTAQAGTYVEKVLDPASKKFRDAAEKILETQNRTFADDFNMPSYSVSAPLNEIMNNLDRINDGAILRELGGFMSSYTGFFKAYATLSPGFHVRNSISNSFQLFAAGAEVKNMKAGLKLWRSLGEHVKSGGTLESWLSSGAVPAGMESQARIAGEVALALGGGKTDDAFAEFVGMGKNVLTDNAATRASRSFGQRVEGSARFMLAFDSAVKGDGFNDAFNRTSRFLVDYNNPTLLDESVRNILPFWTWMSRNLPVQITTQWTNPKPYVVYQRFVNNFSTDEDEQLPPYLREKNPIQVGKGTFLAPDLPFMAAQETINLASNPRKALSMVNPGLRVPLELAGGKTFFTGREFGSEPGQQSAMGYSAQNLLPMLGQIDRITDTSAGSDQLGLARYLGIPVRGMTDEKRNNELQRRLIELQQLQRNTEGA